MKARAKFIAAVLIATVVASVNAQTADSYMPAYMAFEGQLKGVEPPAWQMIANLRTKSEAEINPRGNQLLSSLVAFVKKHGDAASGVLITISTQEAQFPLWNKVIGVVLEEASFRTSSAAIEKLQITVTLTDPESKAEKTLKFQKQ